MTLWILVKQLIAKFNLKKELLNSFLINQTQTKDATASDVRIVTCLLSKKNKVPDQGQLCCHTCRVLPFGVVSPCIQGSPPHGQHTAVTAIIHQLICRLCMPPPWYLLPGPGSSRNPATHRPPVTVMTKCNVISCLITLALLENILVYSIPS
jgi:hypothetical protein